MVDLLDFPLDSLLFWLLRGLEIWGRVCHASNHAPRLERPKTFFSLILGFHWNCSNKMAFFVGMGGIALLLRQVFPFFIIAFGRLCVGLAMVRDEVIILLVKVSDSG